MINYPIIDTHLHIWDLKKLQYPWLETFPILNRTYLMNDFDEAREEYGVDKVVFVQCECLPGQYLDELTWITSIAKKDARIQGIVPWAPLEKGESVRSILEQMVSQNPLIKGIRRIIQFEPDINYCLSPDFIKGVQLVGELGMHFEITIAPQHMENTLKMLKQCPGMMFILDHIANPNIAENITEPWATYLLEIGRMENVFCKVSSLPVNANLENWQPKDLEPFLKKVIESFGFERIIYGGDWPHALRATSYVRWLETLDLLTQGYSEDERHKLFRENAIRFYRL